MIDPQDFQALYLHLLEAQSLLQSFYVQGNPPDDANDERQKVIMEVYAKYFPSTRTDELARTIKPMPEMQRDYLRQCAHLIQSLLPDEHGFILLAFPYAPGRLVYTASCERSDAIKVLKEFLYYVGETENWMKHVQ